MERIKTLIDKLNQQQMHEANPAQLLLTVQLLQSELLQLQQKNGTLGTAKVAVTLPMNMHFSGVAADQSQQLSPASSFQEQNGELSPSEFYQNKEITPPPQLESSLLPKEKIKEQPIQKVINPAFSQNTEPPTLVQHQVKKELHEVIADKRESLNDRLKQEKTEVFHTIKEAPIKDLRKAIGINDRFTFVNELFRGDDAMYERSIKTLNGFLILSEAEYWINRELKFKLGWNDTKETVQHFYQLVRRRFS